MANCGIDLEQLNQIEQDLKSRGESDSNIKLIMSMIQMESQNTGSVAEVFNALGAKETWTGKDQVRLDELEAKIIEEMKKGTDFESSLTEEESLEFKYFHLKRSSSDNEGAVVARPLFTARQKSLDYLNNQIDHYDNIGQKKKADRLRKAKEAMETRKKHNEKFGKNFSEVYDIRYDLSVVDGNLAMIDSWMVNVDGQVRKLTNKIKTLQGRAKKLKDKSNVTKIKEELDALHASKRKLILERKSLKKRDKEGRNKLQEQINSKSEEIEALSETLRKESQPIKEITNQINKLVAEREKMLNRSSKYKVLKAQKKRIESRGKALIKRLNEGGFANEGFIHNVLDNLDTAVTARQMAEDLQRARVDYDIREKLLLSYFDNEDVVSNKRIPRALIEEVLHQQWLARYEQQEIDGESEAEPKKRWTKEEVEAALSFWQKENYRLAGQEGLLIFDLAFANNTSLEALREQSENKGKTIDDTNNETIIVPMLSLSEAIAKSTPGIVPEENKLSPAEMANRLMKLLRKLESWRSSANHGKFLNASHLNAEMASISGINDVSPSIAFAEALVTNVIGDTISTDFEDRKAVLRSLLHIAGLKADEIASMPEIQDYDGWITDLDEDGNFQGRVASLDIETMGKDNSIITGIGLVDLDGNPLGDLGFKVSATDGELTAEQANEILNQIHELQNKGWKIATFNGNDFDFRKLGVLANNQTLAFSISLRSIDVFQNLQHFSSRLAGESETTSERFNLDSVAKGLKMESKYGYDTETNPNDLHTLKHIGRYNGLFFLRARGNKITKESFSQIASAVDNDLKDVIIKELNDMEESEAQDHMSRYLAADASLPGQLIYGPTDKEGLMEKVGDNISITHRNRSKGAITVTVGAIAPTWNMVSTIDTKREAKDWGLDWGTQLDEIGTMVNKATSDNYKPEQSQYDLDVVIERVTDAIVRAKWLDPETRPFIEEIIGTAESTLTPEQELAKIALHKAREHSKALSELHQQEFKDNDQRYPMRLISQNEIEFSSEESLDTQRDNYEKFVVSNFLDTLKRKHRKIKHRKINQVASDFDFRERTASEDDVNYAKALLEHIVNKYIERDFDIELGDFGTGKIDYSPAQDVGMALAQIASKQRPGAILRHNDSVWMDKGLPEFEESARKEDKDYEKQVDFLPPLFDEIHAAMPRTLEEVEQAYDDWRLRQRIAFYLDPDNITTLEEAQGLIESLKNREENPNEVLGRTKTPVLRTTPNSRNRGLYDQLPDMNTHRQEIIEMMLDMPQVLNMWIHDGVKLGSRELRYIDPEVAPTYFREHAASPGSMTYSAVASGMGPQLAHHMAYPVISKDAIFESLQRGAEVVKEMGKDAFAKGNYYDYKFNGLHHFAALMLQYSTDGMKQFNDMMNNFEGTSIYELGDFTPEDVYNNAMDETLGALKDRIQNPASPADKALVESGELQKLLVFLETSEDARDSMKNGVIPRLYMGEINAVKSQLADSKRQNQWDIDTDLLAEVMFGPAVASSMRVLDKALGGMTREMQTELAGRLENIFGNIFKEGVFHNKILKELETNHKSTFGKQFALDDLEFAISNRIDFMAEIITPKNSSDGLTYAERKSKTRKDIFNRYAKRIKNAKEFIAEQGGVLTTREQQRELHVRLSGGEESWKRRGDMAAVSILQRTGFKLRNGEKIGNQSLLESQSEIIGRHIDTSDLLNYPAHMVYFTVGQDASGNRYYYQANNHGVTPQNVSDATVATYDTIDEGDNNPYGMWSLEDNNLKQTVEKEGKDAALEQIEIAIARDLGVRMSNSYAPRIPGYSIAKETGNETKEEFWKDLKERSPIEDSAYRRGVLDEADWLLAEEKKSTGDATARDLDKVKKMKRRRKTSGAIGQSLRWLRDPDRTESSDASISYVPSTNSSVKGLGAFRPQFADIPWNERGIFSLQEVHYGHQIDQGYQGRVNRKALSKPPQTVDDVLPRESRGWQSQYEGSESPYVYETPVDFVSRGVLGDNHRIERRAQSLRMVLEKYAVEKGLQHHIKNNDWARLYTIRQADQKVIKPYLQELSGLNTGEGMTRVGDKNNAKLARAEMLSRFTGMFSFHRDVSRQGRKIVEYGTTELGFSPEELRLSKENPFDVNKHNQAFYWADFLTMLSNSGVSNLAPLTMGLDENTLAPMVLVNEGNMLIAGEKTAVKKQTQTITLTVQHNESAQVLYDVFYSQEGRIESKKMLKELMTAEEYDAVEKDGAGFPMLSEIPPNTLVMFMNTMMENENLRSIAIDKIGLHLITDSYGSSAITGDVKFDQNKTLMPGQITGGRQQYEVESDGGLYAITPDIAETFLMTLRNAVVNDRAELVSVSSSQLGVVKSESMELRDTEQQRFYEAQRDGYADEMDVLEYLHASEGADRPRMIENPTLSNEFGQPLAVYDAVYYMTSVDRTTGFNPRREAFAGYLREAASNASVLNLTKEAKLINLLLTKNAELSKIPDLMEAVIIISEGSFTKEDALFKLESYLLGSTTKKQVLDLYEEATKIRKGFDMSLVDAYRIAASRTEMRNTFIAPAKRYVTQFGPVDELNPNLNQAFTEYIKLDSSNPDQVKLARVAARLANESINELSNDSVSHEGLGFDDEIIAITDPEGFFDKFDSQTAGSINTVITGMVVDGTITDETAGFLRAMIGNILVNNNDFTDMLSIKIDNNATRSGETEKYGGRYAITINPSMLNRLPQPEIIRVFAHELIHVARLKYMSVNDKGWLELTSVYTSEQGRQTMRSMIGIMTNGDSKMVDDAMMYYTKDPDEFLAEWGAYYLMSRVLNNTKVITEIQNLRNNDVIAEKTLHWWDRALNSIKRVGSNILTNLGYMQQANPEVYNIMTGVVDELFNFNHKHDITGRPIATNPDMKLGVRKQARMGDEVTTMEQDGKQVVGTPENDKFRQMGDDIKRFDDLKYTDAKNPGNENHNEYLELETKMETMKGTDVLGIPHTEYVRVLNNMWEMTEDNTFAFRDPRNQKEELVLISYMLKQVAEARGVRVDTPGTYGHLLRKIFPERTLDNLQDIMYNNSNRTDLTWNSKAAILANLTWLLDNTKATTENVFQAEGNGIIHNRNYLEQYSRRVTEALNILRSRYSKDRAKHIEFAAFDYLINKESNLMSALGEEERADAENLSAIFHTNHKALIDLAKEMGLRSATREEHESGLSLRLRRDWLERQDGRRSEFTTALANKQQRKLQDTLSSQSHSGTVDPVLLYMTGLIPRAYVAEDGNIASDAYVSELNQYGQESSGQEAFKKVLEAYAFDRFVKEKKRLGSVFTNAELEADFESVMSSTTPEGAKNKARLYRLGSIDLLKSVTNKSITYADMFQKGGLTQQEAREVTQYLTNNITVSDENRAYDLKHGLADIFRIRTDLRSNIDPFSGSAPTASSLKTAYLLAQVGNSTFIPYKDDTSLTIDDIFGRTANENSTRELSDEDRIIRSGFTTDFKQLIRGTQRGLGSSAFVRKTLKDLTGVNMDFRRILDVLENQVDESQFTGTAREQDDMSGLDRTTSEQRQFLLNGINHIRRVYDVGMNIGNRFEQTDRTVWDMFAKFGPDILTYTWGPNLNAANLIFEGVAAGLNNAMYQGRLPFALYGNIAGNSLRLIGGLRRGLSRMEYNGVLRTVGDSIFDADTAVRDYVERDDVDDGEFFADDERSLAEKAKGNYDSWIRGLRTYNNISAMGIKMAIMQEGHKLAVRNQNNLRYMSEWLKDYNGPRDMNMFKTMKKEIKQKHGVKLRFRHEVGHVFLESGMLKEDQQKKIAWVMANVPSNRGMVDLSSLREMIEKDPAALAEGEDFSMRDLWETASILEKFAQKYSEITVVSPDPLDKDSSGHVAFYLTALYRQFPNIFAAQHILRKGARHGMGPYTAVMAQAVVSDAIYNLLLALMYGLIDEEDMDRWANGQFEMSDGFLLGRSLGRFPGLGIRGNAAAEVVLGLGYGITKYNGNDVGLARAASLGAPLSVIAGVRGLGSFLKLPYDVIAMSASDGQQKSQWEEKALRDTLLWAKQNFALLNDSIFTTMITTSWPDPDVKNPFRSGQNGSSRAVRTNPHSLKAWEDEKQQNSIEGLYRRIYTEMYPDIGSIVQQRNEAMADMMKKTRLPAPPQRPTEAPQQPMALPPAQPMAPPPAAPTAQPEAPAESSRADNPIKSPFFGGGQSAI